MDSITNEIHALYQNIIKEWNGRNARGMAEQFAKNGELIGFDGSLVNGREDIFNHLHPIFANHPTPPFTYVIKDIRLLNDNVALLRAIVGMVPPGKYDIDPALNAHQTLVAVKSGTKWKAELFQNTPAQFHGRPELVEQMTKELNDLLNSEE